MAYGSEVTLRIVAKIDLWRCCSGTKRCCPGKVDMKRETWSDAENGGFVSHLGQPSCLKLERAFISTPTAPSGKKIITIWFYSPSFNERLNCIGFQWILSHYPTNSISFRTQLVFVLISDISHTMMSYKWTQKYFSYFACFSRWAFSFFLRDYSRNSSVTKL